MRSVNGGDRPESMMRTIFCCKRKRERERDHGDCFTLAGVHIAGPLRIFFFLKNARTIYYVSSWSDLDFLHHTLDDPLVSLCLVRNDREFGVTLSLVKIIFNRLRIDAEGGSDPNRIDFPFDFDWTLSAQLKVNSPIANQIKRHSLRWKLSNVHVTMIKWLKAARERIN